MTVRLFLLIFVIALISCKPKAHCDIEMVVYHWTMKPEIKQDTLIPYVKCELYAQINRDGECVLVRTRYLDNDLHSKFTISKTVLEPVFTIIESLNSDTIMTRKSGYSLYDGPTIKIIGLNKKGHSHSVRFDCTERSNSVLLRFYNYIDSISEKQTSTDPFIKAKEERINEIYDSEIKSVPIIIPDNEVIDE